VAFYMEINLTAEIRIMNKETVVVVYGVQDSTTAYYYLFVVSLQYFNQPVQLS
jgi:hypothetical protein